MMNNPDGDKIYLAKIMYSDHVEHKNIIMYSEHVEPKNIIINSDHVEH